MSEENSKGEIAPGAARPVLRVGVTGHRLDKLPSASLARLRDDLRDIFTRLEAKLSSRDGRALHAAAPPACQLVSALAEGTDRLAVDAAPAHWQFHALLPMPRAIYRDDFLPEGAADSASAADFVAYLARADSVSELPMAQAPPGAPPPERALQYAALAHALVGQIDCLVAVWDGRPPRGPGGTAAVIAEAVDLGLAALWIDPEGKLPPRRILRFLDNDLTRPETGPADGAALDDLVTGQLRERCESGRPGGAASSS